MKQEKMIGRNDPCPCDSGKKFKKCCLPIWDTVTINEAQVLRAERRNPGHISRVVAELDREIALRNTR
jgi:hypothetical protein